MTQSNERILTQVLRYYSRRLCEYGAEPAGVDWNGEASQILRFQQLGRLWSEQNEAYSLIDYGCGYGAMVPWLVQQGQPQFYTGIDIAPSMLEKANELFGDIAWVDFTHDRSDIKPHDFVIASGIFNVKEDVSIPQWEAYIHDTLDRLHALCARGFAFNMLTSWSDPPKMRHHLYYADPCSYFSLCKKKYSRNVALFHDYGLYEFTIIVRGND